MHAADESGPTIDLDAIAGRIRGAAESKEPVTVRTSGTDRAMFAECARHEEWVARPFRMPGDDVGDAKPMRVVRMILTFSAEE